MCIVIQKWVKVENNHDLKLKVSISEAFLNNIRWIISVSHISSIFQSSWIFETVIIRSEKSEIKVSYIFLNIFFINDRKNLPTISLD